MSKNTRNRILLTAVAALLLVTLTIGGTVAWLTAKTDAITNTFTPSNVAVEIDETTGNSYKVIPSVNIAKDPKVTATYDVDSYLFVVVTEENWDANLGWSINSEAWSQLMDGETAVANVFYKELTANTDGTSATDSFYVLAGDENNANGVITVSADMDLDDMKTITTNVPQLSFQAYIIQKEGFASAKLAWDEVSK